MFLIPNPLYVVVMYFGEPIFIVKESKKKKACNLLLILKLSVAAKL